MNYNRTSIKQNIQTLIDKGPIMVKLYSKPACMQCDATKFSFQDKGIEYQEIDLTQDPEALKRFKAQGFSSAPIVVTPDETWSGFRPEKIAAL
jgi:glutaredoxin-like protein NrdH